MLAENALNIYTDGSSYSSPRRGGVGMLFVLVDDRGNEESHEYSPPGYANATNNQMELQAPILALAEAKRMGLVDRASKIVIHTDSMYLCDNVNKAKFEWPKTRWCKRSGAPVANAQQWKQLVKAVKAVGRPVEFRWVKGHSKDTANRQADKLAKKSAKTPLNPSLTTTTVRRKKTSESVVPGCVKMLGQRLTIRIITDEYLRVQRLWKLKYEVMSRKSPYFGKVDWIFSEEMLKAGHTYHVRVNEMTGNPRVTKVFREIVA